ncbi:hypothetical protein [Halobacillus alkaliphilus]|nr:hypothetical protein [Halobacillus alkaliphilus]
MKDKPNLQPELDFFTLLNPDFGQSEKEGDGEQQTRQKEEA